MKQNNGKPKNKHTKLQSKQKKSQFKALQKKPDRKNTSKRIRKPPVSISKTGSLKKGAGLSEEFRNFDERMSGKKISKSKNSGPMSLILKAPTFSFSQIKPEDPNDEESLQETQAKRRGNPCFAIGSNINNMFSVLSDDTPTIEGEQQNQQVVIQPATFSLPNSITALNDDSDL